MRLHRRTREDPGQPTARRRTRIPRLRPQRRRYRRSEQYGYVGVVMITLNCPKCGKTLNIPDEYAGKTGKCVDCQTPIHVPIMVSPILADKHNERLQVNVEIPEEKNYVPIPPPVFENDTNVNKSRKWTSSLISKIRDYIVGSNTQKNFQFLILGNEDEIPLNRWYRKDHWRTPNFLVMKTEWSKDWKCFERQEKVVGVTFEGREKNFLMIGDSPDLRIFLQRDFSNIHDSNAIIVMASGTVNGKYYENQIGHLAKETAELLKDELDLDARPFSVWLPYGDCSYGLSIQILVRSEAYKKRLAKGK